MVPPAPSDQPGRFPTTQWSRVILAGDPDAPLARGAAWFRQGYR